MSVEYVLKEDITYWEIKSLPELYKKENMENFANDIMKKIIKRDNKADEFKRSGQDVILRVVPIKLPFVPGSSLSLEFMKAVADLGESKVFNSHTMQKILQFKWKKVKWLGYTFSLVFCIYLAMITFIQKWWIVLMWFFIQVSIEGF